MKPLIIIPARGGSKGVPRKNIKLLKGIPLIHYTIKAAQKLFDNALICVSTDDEEIKKVAEQTSLVVPFLRPKELASDSSGTYEVLMHAIEHFANNGYEADTLILLQPTSPFRTSSHIEEALKIYSNEIDMVVSVKETRSNPYYVLFEEDENGYLKKSKDANFIRRQDCPKVWEYNGAIYIININSLKKKTLNQFTKVRKFVMDDFSSHDIDTLFDWEIAKTIIEKI
ncbi:MAG: acylneuraminate cytidylyltransferase family protein [Flavobacterium sp.]|nr:acylneuraminate cytidylyltransferase family protein [Flavobacterium sp.]